MTLIDIDHLQSWIGRTETATDHISQGQVTRISALLDKDRAPQEGEELPPLWHWCFFTSTAPQAEIGTDGHPKLGGFLPPVPLPRRMWAGGRLRFQRSLRVGDTVARHTEIISVEAKTGKQGALVFLTLRHQFMTGADIALEEEQDIVYRAPTTTRQPGPRPSTEQQLPADWRDDFDPDPVRLFRYSALTFNAHRIHYDLPYATGEEGYPGLVVQGPLSATLLMDAYLRHTGAKPAQFSFRGQAPLFSGQALTLCGQAAEAGTHDLWVEGTGGYLAMSAKATSKGGTDAR